MLKRTIFFEGTDYDPAELLKDDLSCEAEVRIQFCGKHFVYDYEVFTEVTPA